MWTLASNMAEEWTPRTCLRTEAEPAEAAEEGISETVFRVLLKALEPFEGAKIAVADALDRFVRRRPGGSP